RPGPREPPMEPTASRPAVPAPAPDATALAALLDCEADLDALERALLVAAVHPAWGGGRDAWLARWDERRGWLEGWRARAPRAARRGGRLGARARLGGERGSVRGRTRPRVERGRAGVRSGKRAAV